MQLIQRTISRSIGGLPLRHLTKQHIDLMVLIRKIEVVPYQMP